MKWFGLYKKISKQPVKVTKNKDVIAIIDGKEKVLLLKFKKDGTPYFITQEEYNYNHCKECSNYNTGDGYDDVSKCYECSYYNK